MTSMYMVTGELHPGVVEAEVRERGHGGEAGQRHPDDGATGGRGRVLQRVPDSAESEGEKTEDEQLGR